MSTTTLLSMAGRKKTELVLDDPRALRALAHPARQRLIDELYSDRVLTATQAAALVDLTPSAVSHHLRALEKWGIVRRAAATGDGRERPWEATAQSLSLQATGAAGSTHALNSVVHVKMDELTRRLDAFVAGGKDPWSGAYRGLATGDLWLTEEETRELNQAVLDLVDSFERGRRTTRRRRDARRATYAWIMVPLEPPPGP
jgi:DNA-binding transcriptional ArsR family regulator